MPPFTPPVAHDRSPVYEGGNDRRYPVPRLGQRLMAHYGGQPRGRTVLKIAGTYAAYDTPSAELVDTATEVYVGGHVYEVSDAVSADLNAIFGGPIVTEGGDVLTSELGVALTTEVTIA